MCHHIIVRADLTPGQQIAQAVHAAGESVIEQVPNNTVAVALAARDQAHLHELIAKLEAAGIPHKPIVECDGELMAIGIRPTRDRKPLRKLLSQLPLAGRGLFSLPNQQALQLQLDAAQRQLKALQTTQVALQAQLHATPWQRLKTWFHRKAATMA